MTKANKKTYFLTDLSEKPTEWLSVTEKNNFIKKVYRTFIYSLLFSAMTAYFGVCMELSFSLWWIILELVVFVICILAERNLFLLYLWTSLSGLTSAPILTNIINEGNENIIWQAILVTAILFCILSLYVHYSKKTFSHWNLILFTVLVLCVLTIVPLIVFPNYTAIIIWTVIGIFLFSGYVLFDTSNIINRYRPGDEVMAAMDLHLDFTNLFWDFLRLFRRNNAGAILDNETITDTVIESDVDITDLID
ncbi:MAG: Bax inhibitor-1 family protein [Bacteroidota bacterium]